jgi:hypothetical protein
VKITWNFGEPPNTTHNCCHFNVTEGFIQFHADCTHELKGQRVPMSDVTERFLDFIKSDEA